MNQREVILFGLAPGNGVLYTPVQVQKLFFLLDRNIPSAYGCPVFNFRPYGYGPSDKKVYEVLGQLAGEGLVDIIKEQTWKCFRLTSNGQAIGSEIYSSFPPEIMNYIDQASMFVRKLPFTDLVRAIYQSYPEMRENSVFMGKK